MTDHQAKQREELRLALLDAFQRSDRLSRGGLHSLKVFDSEIKYLNVEEARFADSLYFDRCRFLVAPVSISPSFRSPVPSWRPGILG